jgi:hypothetical protein
MNSQTESPPEAPNADSGVCPHCGSDDVRSNRSIYDVAKNYSRSSLSRVAVTGGAGFYLDGANVRPTTETLLAAKFPPPKKPKFSWWLFAGIVVTAAFLVFVLMEWVGISRPAAVIIGLACVAIDYAIQHLVVQKQMSAYRRDYEAWKNTRVCLDCEESFNLTAAA